MTLVVALAALTLSQDQFSRLVDLLLKAAEALIVLGLVPFLGWRATKYSTAKQIESHQTILGNATPPAVAAVYNEKVKDLKDPAKPEAGGWTDEAKRAARDMAVEKVLTAFPTQAAYLQEHGVDVRAMLAQSVEKGVLALDAIIATAAESSAKAVGEKNVAAAVVTAADAVTKAAEAVAPTDPETRSTLP